MGQKVNPISLRLGINNSWHSAWYSDLNMKEILHEDLQIRHYLDSVYKRNGYITGIAKIERSLNSININLSVSEPLAFVKDKIQKRKSLLTIDTSKLQQVIEKITNFPISFSVTMVEPYDSSTLLAKDIAIKLENRLPFASVMKRYIKYATSVNNVVGVKIQCSGRLNGDDIARTEWLKEGEIPLHTIKSKIDYGYASAYTIYGIIGIKVWICKK